MAPTAQTAPAPAQQEVFQQVQQLRSQLQQVEQRLQQVQQNALAKPEVQAEKNSYDDALKEAMVALKPELENALEKRDEIVSELTASNELNKPAEQRSEDFHNKIAEFQKLNAEIQPVAERASQAPEVQESFQQYEKALVSEMEKEEPNIQQLFAQHTQLRNQYQQLVQQMQ